MLISVHFWAVAVGITVYVVGLSIGGIKQGMEMNNADIPFLKVVADTIPYLLSRSLSGILITIGHLAFAVNFAWMLLRPRAAQKTEPTLFHTPPEMEIIR